MNEVLFRAKPYQQLRSYQRSDVAFQGTVRFCRRFLDSHDRTVDQMVQAARSGKQNIVEGALAGAASSETELKLTNVALASLGELREDYLDYLHTHDAAVWAADSKEAVYARNLCHKDDGSYEKAYKEFIETRPANVVANIMLCVISQTTFLLSRQIKALEQNFLRDGGVRERMTKARLQVRNRGNW